jgi:hypothetical protein
MGMKFRVLRGNHSEGTYPSGHPWAGKSIVYEIGEIVDSASNLAKFNAAGPLGPKFQRVYDPNMPATDKVAQGLAVAKQQEAAAIYDDGNGPHGPNVQPQLPSDGLEELTIAELKKLAKEEGVNLPANVSKEEAIQAIRKSSVLA